MEQGTGPDSCTWDPQHLHTSPAWAGELQRALFLGKPQGQGLRLSQPQRWDGEKTKFLREDPAPKKGVRSF